MRQLTIVSETTAVYSIACSFAQRELDWRPLHDFREGLESTIDWYLNNRPWWEALLERAGRY